MKDVKDISINKKESIKEAMRIIDRGGVKTGVVIDDKNKLCGIVTDGDIRRGILEGKHIDEEISNVMNLDPVFAYISDSKQKVIEVMKKKDIIGGIPIVDGSKTVRDFAVITEGKDISYFNMSKHINNHLKKILVIGGAGYLGSVLVKKLLAKGYSVNVLDKFIYVKDSLKSLSSNPYLNVIEGDTRHIEDINQAIKGVDAVVHLAELVGDPACALNPQTTQEINYLATKTTAEICKHFQINRMVYASSCSVYGASKDGNLLTEDSPLNPVSLYAKMKIASEDALLEMKDENFLPTILRFATIFGHSSRPRFDLVVNTLTAKAVKEGKITIFGGDQWRPNVYVGDVADTIISVLEAPIEKVGGEIFNVGSEKNNYTINQIGEMIKEAVPSAELIIDEKDIDKRDYKVDFTKLRETLNMDLKTSIIDGVNEIKSALETGKTLDYTDSKYSNIKFLEDNGRNL
ncbi:NAD-dependent epimerase/dehydratase family protein [Candidatus Woesearchaeota archaeon]|nr:NAD-dependent epimerase/dehydratase family protein [Candidatus Woesearchaeota archaeon]